MPIELYYLDASAAVKLVADEPDSHIIRTFVDSNSHHRFFMTNICLAEALGVLKQKWLTRKEMEAPKYRQCCRLLLTRVIERRIQIEEPPLTNAIFSQTERLAEQYSLDFSDAFQLVTLQHVFQNIEPARMLITADEQLAKAAEAEGLHVYDYREGQHQQDPHEDLKRYQGNAKRLAHYFQVNLEAWAKLEKESAFDFIKTVRKTLEEIVEKAT